MHESQNVSANTELDVDITMAPDAFFIAQCGRKLRERAHVINVDGRQDPETAREWILGLLDAQQRDELIMEAMPYFPAIHFVLRPADAEQFAAGLQEMNQAIRVIESETSGSASAAVEAHRGEIARKIREIQQEHVRNRPPPLTPEEIQKLNLKPITFSDSQEQASWDALMESLKEGGNDIFSTT